MKNFLALCVLLLSVPALAQVTYSTVTATVTDPSGNPYANAAYSISLVNAQGFPVSSASTPNGSLFNVKQVNGFLDATGHLSAPLMANTLLSNPSGTQWKFFITAPTDTSILLYQPPWTINYSVSITGNVDLSSQLSALAAPVIFVNLKTGQTSITADDPTARAAAAAAQSTANSAQSTANAAVPASGGAITGNLNVTGTVVATAAVSGSNLSPAGHASADLSLSGGALSGPLSGPSLNGAQAAGQGTNTSIQAAVTAAGGTGAVSVPPSFSPGELQYTGAKLSQSLTATSTYTDDGLSNPPTDLRSFNQSMSFMQVIDLAPLETEATFGSTTGIVTCIKAGACTVVYVGHSIMENVNDIAPDDSGLQKLSSYLTYKFPAVTWTFLNYSLSGDTVEQFNDATYTCEPTGSNNYFRPALGSWYGTTWSTPANYPFITGPMFYQWPGGCNLGLSWKQMVLNANPNLVLFDFGVNEAPYTVGQYTTDLQTAITWAQGLSSSPTVVLGTDDLPNLAYEPSDDYIQFEAINQATRDMAKKNNLLLVDAGRRFSMFRTGIDPTEKHAQYEGAFNSFSVNCAYPSYPSGWQAAPTFSGALPSLSGGGTVAANITIVNSTNPLQIQRTRRAWDFTIDVTATVNAVGGTAVLGFRDDPSSGEGYYITATATSSTAFTVVFGYTPFNFSSLVTIGTYSCTGSALSVNLKLRTDGARDTLWCGTVAVPVKIMDLWDFNKLYPGVLTLGMSATGGNIGNEYIEYRNPDSQFTPLVESLALMGSGDDFYKNPNSVGGNADKHPGPSGMEAMYLAAWSPVLAAIERDAKIATGIASASAASLSNGTVGTGAIVLANNPVLSTSAQNSLTVTSTGSGAYMFLNGTSTSQAYVIQTAGVNKWQFGFFGTPDAQIYDLANSRSDEDCSPSTGICNFPQGVTQGGSKTPITSSTTPTVNAGVCWKTATTLGTCTAGTWPNCTTCN